jgi:tetratricopeptide (TPR) repeat protein
VLVIRAARRRPYLVVGWFWYAGTLVPVIGLIQAGYQSRADRFTYVPLIGLFIMAVWGIVDLVGRRRYRGLMLGAAAALVIVAYAITARMQTGYWRSDRALWEHCLEVTNLNYVAEAKLGKLGKALADERQAAAAGVHYSAALRLNPNIPEVHNELGILLAEAGKLEEAVGHYREAVRLKPDYAEAHDNIGVALASQGRVDEAIREFQTALKIRPDFMDARKNLAVALREREQ